MIYKFHRLIRTIKIQNRLVISFTLLSLIPLLITGIFTYYKSSEAIKTKISAYSVQLMSQVGKNINDELDKLENESVDIAYSDAFQSLLQSYDTLSGWGKNDAQFKMQRMLTQKLTLLKTVSDVLVYTKYKEKIIAYGDVSFKFELKHDYLDRIFKETSNNSGAPLWSSEGRDNEIDFGYSSFRLHNYGRNGILLSRSLNSLQQGIPIGYMIIRINERSILEMYKNINLGKGADIFIINSQGVVISSNSSAAQSATIYKDHALTEKLIKNKGNGVYSFNGTISGKRYLIAYSYLPGADWFVVSTIPYSYLNDESIKIGIYITLLGIMCLIIALFLSVIVSKSISKPLNRLVNSMKNVRNGNFAIQIEDNSSDELGVVTSHFNNMVMELEFLIEEVKSKENLKRIAELKTLQAQINPHFLSNTLNTVRWLANIQKAENISSIITSLIQLLQTCMGRGEEWVYVREEIDYVNNYLNIMTYRYYDKFRVHYELEEGILDCKILRFILQPLIENSLMHGIEPMEGHGIIIIKGYRVENKLIITITDNGVGITSEVQNAIRQSKQNHHVQLSGIGIRNVDERIKLYFGEKYGISVQSVPNLFTTVEISIPAVEEGDALYVEGNHCGR